MTDLSEVPFYALDCEKFLSDIDELDDKGVHEAVHEFSDLMSNWMNGRVRLAIMEGQTIEMLTQISMALHFRLNGKRMDS